MGPIFLFIIWSDLVCHRFTVSAQLVTDWRVLTVQCIDAMDYSSVSVRTRVASLIYDFLLPLAVQQSSDNDRRALRDTVEEMCDQAVAFRMMMRRSKDLYAVKVPGEGGLPRYISACRDMLVQAMGVEGGQNSEADDEIVYTVFGALTKVSQYGGGDELVLEPAHVILKGK